MAPWPGIDEAESAAMADLHRLNLQQLLYLDALVAERHVTRAAERVGIGQPAMSAALARLRDVFRDPLLVKTSLGMEPTPRALELVRRIREISDLLEGRGRADEPFDPATSEMRFRIMSSDGISRLVLPALMQEVGRSAPRMRFIVAPGDQRRLAEYLRDGDIDLALAFVREPSQELRQTLLYPQRLMCIARRDHPHIRGKVSLAEFMSHEHATWGAPPVPNATIEAMVEEALARLGHERQVSLRVSSITLLPGVVAQSDLLAVVPEHLATFAHEMLALQTLPLPFKVGSVDVSMLWHNRMHQDPAHVWLRGVLRGIGHGLARTELGPHAL